MHNLSVVENNEELKLDNLNLPKESLELMANELGKTPSLYTIVTTFYKYSIYKGLDYLYDNYNYQLCSDSFMESVFLYLAKLGDENKIEYFYKKNKDAIENRDSFDKFSIYKNQEIIEGSCEYSDYYFEPIFNEGLKALCTKNKYNILKKLYLYGFKASISQLKVATRTLNEEVFYTVFDELNSKLIADYVPKLVEELCYYSKLEPIKFLFERIGADYISQESLNKCLINVVNGNSKSSKLDIFSYMVSLGADIKCNNYKIFDKVFGYGHLEILNYIFETYSEIDEEDEYDFEKYVDLAMKYNKVNIIEYLIKTYRYNKKNYNFIEDRVLLEKYCSQFNKNKEVVEYLIKEVYKNDKEYINELKLKFPRQRKFQEFISNI